MNYCLVVKYLLVYISNCKIKVQILKNNAIFDPKKLLIVKYREPGRKPIIDEIIFSRELSISPGLETD